MTLPAVIGEVPVEITLPRYGIVPRTIQEAIQLAELMATAKLVPVGLQKSPADCLMVIQQAIRWDMDPFAVAQECSVIQGKLMHSGKLVAAVVNTRGNLAKRLTFAFSGENETRAITLQGTLQGELEPTPLLTVKWKDAKTNNSMWVKQPDQQLVYHGVRVWARRYMPELMLGVQSPEEFDEGPRRPAPPAINVIQSPPMTASPAAESPATSPTQAGDAPAPSLAHIPPESGAGDYSIDDLMAFDNGLGVAAKKGMAELEEAWGLIPNDAKASLKAALDRRHKLTANQTDMMAAHAKVATHPIEPGKTDRT